MQPAISSFDLSLLLKERQSPCLSLYQNTFRHNPENLQDPIRFKNLLKELERLCNDRGQPDSGRLLENFRKLEADREFWNNTLDGLAIFCSEGFLRIFSLRQSVTDAVLVSDHFLITPLIRIVQSAERYQVLSLNRKEVHLFEGIRDRLTSITLVPQVPQTITDALGSELTEPHQTVTSQGGTGLGSSMRHGQGGKADEVENDEERFFRTVDRAIFEYYSRPSGLPLILASLVQYHSIFHKISHNSLLIAESVAGDADSFSVDDLGKKAWELIEPRVHARIAGHLDKFSMARSRNLGSDELAAVAGAAAIGRVGTLLIEAGRRIAGSMDAKTGAIALDGTDGIEIAPDDVIDQIAEAVLRHGGTVEVVEKTTCPKVRALLVSSVIDSHYQGESHSPPESSFDQSE